MCGKGVSACWDAAISTRAQAYTPPFSVPIAHVELEKSATEKCVHCGQNVQYFIDSTVAATDVLPSTVLDESHRRMRSVKAVVQEVKAVNSKIAKKT